MGTRYVELRVLRDMFSGSVVSLQPLEHRIGQAADTAEATLIHDGTTYGFLSMACFALGSASQRLSQTR
jgi:hypothetical protein